MTRWGWLIPFLTRYSARSVASISGVSAASILSGKAVRVESTRPAIRRLSFRVFTCSRMGSTLSCRSLL